MARMNKKAVGIVAEWIVNLVFLLLVIMIFLSVAYKIKDDKLHILRVEARDFAFTRDALSVSPYSFDYTYSLSENVTISLNDNCLVQARYKKDNAQPVGFFCGLDNFGNFNMQEIGGKLRVSNG